MKNKYYYKKELRQELTNKVFKNAESISYEDDSFEIIQVYQKNIAKRNKPKDLVTIIKIIIAPATNKNWEVFKKFYFFKYNNI